ncbi:MAG: Rieske 2Fe-2S domain-containing protein [Chloroflexales bacterium]|nr:Rieske 2Fe-2S domain-containing protein [Chloroflexales bacterium]
MARNHLGPSIEGMLRRIPGFAKAADGVATTLHSAVTGGGAPARRVGDVLHGTWLGHPLHALLVGLPLGTWSASALFDLVALVTRSGEATWAADALLTTGVVTAVPAALAGAMDYSAASQEATPEIALHGILNSAALGLFLASLAARRRGRRGTGVLLSYGALTIAAGSAWLGGDLTYRHRVGVNHAEVPDHADGWIAVLDAGDLAAGAARRVMVGGTAVMVYRSAEAVYALGAVCSHAGGPLDEGTVEGHCVKCPWHQSVFDMRDGHVVHGPATMPQARYEARASNGLIQVRRWHEQQASAESPAPEARPGLDDDGMEQEVGGLGI